MRVIQISVKDAGPLGTQEISFLDSWKGVAFPRIVLHGVNGSGKSTVLRLMATLWDALGLWMEKRSLLPQNHQARQWLQQWGGVSMLLDGIPGCETPVRIAYGDPDWIDAMVAQDPAVPLIGEKVDRTGKPGKPARHIMLPKEKWFVDWAAEHNRLVLTFEDAKTPNLVFLDAEERRWVKPSRNIGDLNPESPKERWTVRYAARDDWKGQLEASLISLKTTDEKTFKTVLKDLNALLKGKAILKEILTGENRLRVKIDRTGNTHSLDELSAGEHQVLILVYTISRWLQEGGLVLVDEPDQYLHPSLIQETLGALERLVEGRGGQLFISSHSPEVWSRYEDRDHRIKLEGP